MIYFVLVLAIGLFVFCLKTLSVIPTTNRIVLESRDALHILRSKDMSEEQKETAVQAAAVRMFRAFFSILFRVSLCLGIPAGGVVIGSVFEFYQLEEVVLIVSSGPFIIGSTFLMILGWKIFK